MASFKKIKKVFVSEWGTDANFQNLMSNEPSLCSASEEKIVSQKALEEYVDNKRMDAEVSSIFNNRVFGNLHKSRPELFSDPLPANWSWGSHSGTPSLVGSEKLISLVSNNNGFLLHSSLYSPENFFISMFVRPLDTSIDNMVFFDFVDATNNHRFYLRQSLSAGRLILSSVVGGVPDSITVDGLISNNAWVHVACGINFQGGMSLWTNGVLQGSSSGLPMDTTILRDLYLGGKIAGNTPSAEFGCLDIVTRVMTNSEVLNIFNAGEGKTIRKAIGDDAYNGLEHTSFWDFEEGSDFNILYSESGPICSKYKSIDSIDHSDYTFETLSNVASIVGKRGLRNNLASTSGIRVLERIASPSKLCIAGWITPHFLTDGQGELFNFNSIDGTQKVILEQSATPGTLTFKTVGSVNATLNVSSVLADDTPIFIVAQVDDGGVITVHTNNGIVGGSASGSALETTLLRNMFLFGTDIGGSSRSTLMRLEVISDNLSLAQIQALYAAGNGDSIKNVLGVSEYGKLDFACVWELNEAKYQIDMSKRFSSHHLTLLEDTDVAILNPKKDHKAFLYIDSREDNFTQESFPITFPSSVKKQWRGTEDRKFGRIDKIEIICTEDTLNQESFDRKIYSQFANSEIHSLWDLNNGPRITAEAFTNHPAILSGPFDLDVVFATHSGTPTIVSDYKLVNTGVTGKVKLLDKVSAPSEMCFIIQVKPTAIADGERTIFEFSNRDGSDVNIFALRQSATTGKIDLLVYEDGSGATIVSNNAVLVNGSWIMLVFQVNSSGNVELWTGDTLEKSQASVVSGINTTALRDAFIFNKRDQLINSFKGDIGRIEFASTFLNGTQIASLDAIGEGATLESVLTTPVFEALDFAYVWNIDQGIETDTYSQFMDDVPQKTSSPLPLGTTWFRSDLGDPKIVGDYSLLMNGGSNSSVQLFQDTLGGNLSLGCWFNPDIADKYVLYAHNPSGVFDDNGYFYYTATGTIKFEFKISGTLYGVESARTYPTGSWIAAYATWDASGEVKLYVQGELVASKTGLPALPSLSRIWRVGGHSTTASDFDGVFGRVEFEKGIIITESEARLIWNNGRGNSLANILK